RICAPVDRQPRRPTDVEPTTIIIIIVALVVVIGGVILFGRKQTPEIETKAPERLPVKKPAEARAKEPKAPVRREEPKPAVAKSPPAASEARDDEEEPEEEEDEEVEPSASPPPAPLSRRKRDVKGLRKGLGKVRGETGLFGRL